MNAWSMQNVLEPSDIQYILSLAVVEEQKQNIHDENPVVKFAIELPVTLKQRIENSLGMDLSNIEKIPMRWVKGDTMSHTDRGETEFSDTYLIYVTNSLGELVVNENNYPIEAGTAYVFEEGTEHSTVNTQNSERLMIGPMSEIGFPVGYSGLLYYPVPGIYSDYTVYYSTDNIYIYGIPPLPTPSTPDSSYSTIGNPDWTIPQGMIFAGWSFEYGSILDQSGNDILQPGQTFNIPYYQIGNAALVPYFIPSPSNMVCFKEDTKILTDKGYIFIQDLQKGDLVKTLCHGYVAVYGVGYKEIEHVRVQERIKDQLYKCTQDKYPELLEDLILTGCHSILVKEFKEGEREKTEEVLTRVFITDNKYRLPACVDERASVYEEAGKYTIYHFALNNDDDRMNYGVYANGLLVESCSIRYLTELSGMKCF